MKKFNFRKADQKAVQLRLDLEVQSHNPLGDATRDGQHYMYYNAWLPYVHEFLSGAQGKAAREEVGCFLKKGLRSGACMKTASQGLWREAITELRLIAASVSPEEIPEAVNARFTAMNERWVDDDLNGMPS